MLIVLVLLTIVATVAISTFSSHQDDQKLILATEELASALRYARSEAIRTRTTHHVLIEISADAFSVSDQTNTVIYHPVSKKLYELNFTTDSMTNGVDIVSVDGLSTGTTTINFLSAGQPSRSTDSTIILSFAGQTRGILIAATTGRISVLE